MTEFDVFLCHNSQDKPEVIEIALQLQQRGLKPWLDAWELPPGQSWQELLEEQIEQVKSAAVFVGSSGLGPWQEREMRAFLSEFVDRGCPVIPVLLEQAPQKPKLPIFLKALTWVDFRHAESNPLKRLIWGITGIKPADFDSSNNKGVAVKREKYQAQSFTENLGNGINLEMIAIPGGKFLMGTEDQEIERLCKEYRRDRFKNEKPQHQVTVPSFALGKYPITQTQYQQVMSKNPLVD
ncbi:MAG: TIR domain-containing protein [Waterburya sp.]